jgi:predicted TPR repeat methyltransferase
LASENFSKVGLKIFGLDTSKEMIDACQAKSFTESLKECDIVNEHLPFDKGFFNHVICCGVLQFIGDLSKLFSEIKRVMKSEGIFSFTIASVETTVDYSEEPTAWGVSIFKHSSQYIQKLLKANNMELLKEQRILIKGEDKKNYSMQFSVIVCKLL